jgi:hypothetical protein
MVVYLGSFYTTEEIDKMTDEEVRQHVSTGKITMEEELARQVRVREKLNRDPDNNIMKALTAQGAAAKLAKNSTMMAKKARDELATLPPTASQAERNARNAIVAQTAAEEQIAAVALKKATDLYSKVLENPTSTNVKEVISEISQVNNEAAKASAVNNLSEQLSPINGKIVIAGVVALGLATIIILRK